MDDDKPNGDKIGSINIEHRPVEALLELRIVGRHMRDAQRRYFKTRSHEALIEAKQFERRFDELLK